MIKVLYDDRFCLIAKVFTIRDGMFFASTCFLDNSSTGTYIDIIFVITDFRAVTSGDAALLHSALLHCVFPVLLFSGWKSNA